MLGNRLVGMAAFVALMSRTIIGKYVQVLVIVTAFVASGFMHSPANMAYFSLARPDGIGPGWGAALECILPAAIGNILGDVQALRFVDPAKECGWFVVDDALVDLWLRRVPQVRRLR